MKWFRFSPAAALPTIGCAGPQSVLNPAGIQAERIESLWWLFFVACVAVLVLVTAGLLYAGLHRRTEADPASADADARKTRVVTSLVVITTVVLIILLIASVWTGKQTSALSSKQGLVIQIRGHQWWWEAHYPDEANPSNNVVTANEIHIPVGRPVLFRMSSDDVIHSLWIPNLNGKRDLIPGHITTTWIRADKPGVYRGQCAEFCGLQHAHMALLVIAEPEAQFDNWLNGQRQPAADPQGGEELRGKQVFLNSPCIVCHSIRGTTAGGRIAPDLTHLASRQYIAAGTLPNTIGALGGWIADSQAIKPGNNMPPMHIAAQDLEPLLRYLKSLR